MEKNLNEQIKAVKGEKVVRKAKFIRYVRYAAQRYQFIDLTPLAVGRSFSLDQEDPPYVDEPQQLVDFTAFTHIRFLSIFAKKAMKVEEIGHGTNQCHFPMKIKKAVETSQYMLEWQSSIKLISNKDV